MVYSGSKIKGSSQRSSAMKYRPTDTARSLAKGTKPLAEAASIQQVLVMMVVGFCRKILYGVETSHKVGLYIVGTLILSVIGDFGAKGSPSYMARPDNVFNVYFVKFGWGWTVSFVGIFVLITSYTTSCGRRDILKNQVIRLVLATFVWWSFTGLLEVIEQRTGICSATKYHMKSSCIERGFRWKGFDISGHTFLLIWNNLFILEEAKAYLGWERIRDMLRNEEHKRLSTDFSASSMTASAGGEPSATTPTSSGEATALSRLRNEEFLHLRSNYKSFTPWVRFLFCILSLWVTLWDVMLFCTVMYFHITIEKVVASCLAVLIWFLLYRVIYTKSWSCGLPGDGLFKYVRETARPQRKESLRSRGDYSQQQGKKWTPKDDVPKFMGMPVWGATTATPSSSQAQIMDRDMDVNSGPQSKSSLNARRRSSIDLSMSSQNLRARSRSMSKTRLSSSKSILNARPW